MATTKITRKDMFNAIISKINGNEVSIADSELVAFCEKQIDQLEKKSHTSKPTATQQENIKFKEDILIALSTADRMTVSDLMTIESLKDLTNQRITALLTQLKSDGKVKREVEKKKAYYSIA